MRAIPFVAVLLAVPGGAADRTETAPATVRLVWCDPARVLFTAGFDRVAREVADIFEPLGVRITWRRDDDRPASADELKVILLAADPTARFHRRETMGRVERTRHTALWIFAGGVRQTIGLDPSTIRHTTPEDLRDYPQALGRVVAHELFHAIVPGEPHASGGLMQATLNRALLTGPRLAIDEHGARAFVRELASRSVVDAE